MGFHFRERIFVGASFSRGESSGVSFPGVRFRRINRPIIKNSSDNININVFA